MQNLPKVIYASKNIDKSNFYSKFVNVTYTSPTSANQDYTFPGDVGTYDGGGLLIDLPRNATKEEADILINKLRRGVFVTAATRAVIIEWTLFNPSLNQFSYCRIVFTSG